MRGFGPLGIASILVILFGNVLFVPLSAILALAWAWRSRTPWSEIGYAPQNWLTSAAIGIAFGGLLKLLLKAAVMPLFHAPPVNPAYRSLAANPQAIPEMLYLLVVGAGFGEETVFRGYMFERIGKWMGRTIPAKVATVAITTIWFGAGHYSTQGVPGVQQALITGAIFGTIFAMTGRLWMLMCAHAAFDLTAYALIYWNLENSVAHWIFKAQ